MAYDIQNPAGTIELMYRERRDEPIEKLVGELNALEPLPDEDSDEWESDEPWVNAYLLHAINRVLVSATTIIDRRLVEIFDRGVGDVTGSRSTGGLF
jgi:hypothetical protein